MEQQGSYSIKSITSHVETEIKRLKAQADLFWDKEWKHYLEYGLRDGMRIAEFGCGPGFITEKVLALLPQATITAIEIDPFLVEYAKNYFAPSYQTRCQVLEKSILATGLADNGFDFAITRLVLEHLPDPVAAVREVYRILKPGGKAVFVDNDFNMHILTHPHIPALSALYSAYCQSRFAEGGNPCLGRELPCVLKKGGFEKIDFEVISAHSAIVGEEIFLRSEGLSIPTKLVCDGFLASKDLATVAVGWRNMMKSEGHAILRQLYMAVGEK